MKNYKKILIAVNLVLVVLLFNWSVFKKERLLHHGNLVLLKLAPVDPRSLMQGDYMRLNYDLQRWDVNGGWMKRPPRGYCVVTVDAKHVATLLRFQDEKTPLAAGEQLIKYFTGRYEQVHLGAESYFFQEGTGDKYARAKYGALRVDDGGESLLTGVCDEQGRVIK